MQVTTLSEEALQRDASRLAHTVLSSEKQIDMIIGIATGGAYVSRYLHSHFTQNGWQGRYEEVRLSRASTQTKQHTPLKHLLRHLPYALLNLMRRMEAYLQRRSRPAKPPASCYVPLPLSLETTEAVKQSSHILIIDDAIDSGATMLRLTHTLKEINPNLKLTTAVLTVTQDDPYIAPDYTLYRHTLLRCPWAMDYKGQHA